MNLMQLLLNKDLAYYFFMNYVFEPDEDLFVHLIISREFSQRRDTETIHFSYSWLILIQKSCEFWLFSIITIRSYNRFKLFYFPITEKLYIYIQMAFTFQECFMFYHLEKFSRTKFFVLRRKKCCQISLFLHVLRYS